VRRLLIVPILLAVCFTMGCEDSQIAKAAKGLDVMAHSIGSLQDIAISSNSEGYLSDTETANILDVCLKLNQAGQQGVILVRDYYNNLKALEGNSVAQRRLEDSTMLRLTTLLKPILTTANDSLEKNLLGIKNDKAKERVRAAILIAQTAINTLQGVLLL